MIFIKFIRNIINTKLKNKVKMSRYSTIENKLVKVMYIIFFLHAKSFLTPLKHLFNSFQFPSKCSGLSSCFVFHSIFSIISLFRNVNNAFFYADAIFVSFHSLCFISFIFIISNRSVFTVYFPIVNLFLILRLLRNLF